MPDLAAFAEQVGTDGPVVVIGHGTRGGVPTPGARTVHAPSGIDEVQPEEMTVRCGAGTPVEELRAALVAHGQDIALPEGGTVGGALAVGHSAVTRLGHGAVRDTVLQIRYVGADGQVVHAGGPTVKNVSGFDLCRLLVGSHGTLGLFGEVILRTRPRPPAARWYVAPEGMTAPQVMRGCHRPVAVLSDGGRVWVRVEGHPRDLDELARSFGLTECPAPSIPNGARRVFTPTDAAAATAALAPGTYVLEHGTGVVHLTSPTQLGPPPPPSADVAALEARIKNAFDPHGRLSPGRTVR